MNVKFFSIIVLTILVVTICGFALVMVQTPAVLDNPTKVSGIPVNQTTPVAVPDRAELKAPSRTITDMAGRTVTIPVSISKVLCTSPPPTTFVYMLAPDKLGGWQSRLSNESKKYVPKEYQELTVLSWNPINYEAYIALNPDLIFVWCAASPGTDPGSVSQIQEKFGTIPVVCVDNANNATGYGPTLRFMGEILGVPERADAEIAYYQNVLNEVQYKVSAISEDDRVRVYYAEGSNGLSTDPSGSFHSELIDIAGGRNVAKCEVTSDSGMTGVTKESILMWKPDVIITTNPEFIEQVYDDETWKRVPAVQNRRIYLTPSQPYNWFDRPPGVNRIVGIPWTAHVLYPDLFPDDWFTKRVKEFYSIYYHYDLSDEDLSSLLAA